MFQNIQSFLALLTLCFFLHASKNKKGRKKTSRKKPRFFMWAVHNYTWSNPTPNSTAREMVLSNTYYVLTQGLGGEENEAIIRAMRPQWDAWQNAARSAFVVVGSHADHVHWFFSVRGPPQTLFFDLVPSLSHWELQRTISDQRLTNMFTLLRTEFWCTHFRIRGTPFVWNHLVFTVPRGQTAFRDIWRRAGFPIQFVNGNRGYGNMENIGQDNRGARGGVAHIQDIVCYAREEYVPEGLRHPTPMQEYNYYYYKRRLDFLLDKVDYREGEHVARLDPIPYGMRRMLWKFYYHTFNYMPEPPLSFLLFLNGTANPAFHDVGREQGALVATMDLLLQRHHLEWCGYFARLPWTKYPFLFALSMIARLRHWVSL